MVIATAAMAGQAATTLAAVNAHGEHFYSVPARKGSPTAYETIWNPPLAH